jgi:transposase
VVRDEPEPLPEPKLAYARLGRTERSPLRLKKRPARFVGMDGSKAPLDLAYRSEPTRWRVANDTPGIASCLADLWQLHPTLIGLEAPGGAGLLGSRPCPAERPVAVMNPRQGRDVAKATGPWAKTEALDAGGIAHCESGQGSGARHIHGGRAVVRVVWYRATRTATRVNLVIKVFYQQPRARGKAQQVALTAAMRTLLISLNAMVKAPTCWNGHLKTCA